MVRRCTLDSSLHCESDEGDTYSHFAASSLRFHWKGQRLISLIAVKGGKRLCTSELSQSVTSKAMKGLDSFIAIDSDLPASSDKSCGCLRSRIFYACVP